METKWKADQARNPDEVPSAPVNDDADEDEDMEDSEEESESDEQVERVILETTRKPEEEVEMKMPEKVVPPATTSTSTSTSTAGQQSAANKKLSHLIAEHDEAADEDQDEDDDDLALTLEQKLLASRSLHPTHCLFCSVKSASIEKNLDHMFSRHSFYVPERQFLVDPTGFMLYLAEKLAIGNVCLYCEAEFGTLGAVRGHMKDKSHQKIRYEDDNSRAEYAEWYDFSSSYPDAEEKRLKDVARTERREERRQRREAKEDKRRRREEELEGDGGWEEDDGEGEGEEVQDDEVDEIIVDEAADESSVVSDDTDESDFEEDDHGISLASDGLSLRLPSGRTLGHRSLKVYYQQNLRPENELAQDSNSTALTTKLRSVRAKLADPSLSLVPVGGGSGAFGKGQMVMKARNAGEAKWAKKLGSSHLDQRRKEAPRHLVSMRGGNNQKHYRDMLRESGGVDRTVAYENKWLITNFRFRSSVQ